jgi:membrane-bound lytic murein transglycosylase A
LVNNTDDVKIAKSGKDRKPRVLRKLYTKDLIDTMRLPSINSQLLKALEYQKAFLRQFQDETLGDLKVEADQLEEVFEIFRTAKSSDDLANALDAYQICGDGKGNVKFTGYYSPIISASRKRDDTYNEPIYLAPSTEDIQENTSKNKGGLKVAYVKSSEDIKVMRMEGIAYLKFSNDDRILVSFDGDSHSVESDKVEISHNLVDEAPKKVFTTYSVFTQREKPKPVGAAKVPLTTDLTVAVDPNYIPLGGVLLAKVPILDEEGNLIRQEYRFILAQDTGGRIKGAAHVDLYMGEGQNGKDRIHYMNKYGKIWLLLPKEKKQTKLVAQNL